MAMHPSGRSLVVGLTLGGMRLVEVRPADAAEDPPLLSLADGDFDERSKRFGAVKALSFSADGRLLALGCEDGALEIVSWPGLETKTRWQASPKGLRNVDFSAAHSDGVVASVDESGACKLWDVASGEMVAQLHPPPHLPRATFFRCKAAADPRGIALFTPVKFKGEGYVLRWRQDDRGGISLEVRPRLPAQLPWSPPPAAVARVHVAAASLTCPYDVPPWLCAGLQQKTGGSLPHLRL
jgi:WD40 repeat protein